MKYKLYLIFDLNIKCTIVILLFFNFKYIHTYTQTYNNSPHTHTHMKSHLISPSLKISHAYYTYVFSDSPEQVMLAVFSPAGKACCYHNDGDANAPPLSNRPIRLLADDRGGVISEHTGEISRKWDWPPNKGKLSHSIVMQVGYVIFNPNHEKVD